MMNFVALFLVVSSLVSAGIWSPSPDQKQDEDHHRDQVIVKNGHRVVVVEYGQEGHPNTKVSISSPPPPSEQDRTNTREASISNNEVSAPSRVTRAFDKAMGNVKDAGASVGTKMGHGDQGGGHHISPKELICDAYGKCKHKIASALEMKKEIVKGIAHEAKETAQRVEEAVEDAYGKANEKVSEKAHEVKDTAMDMGNTLVGDVKGNVSNAYNKEKEEVVEKAKEVKETAEHAADKVKAGAEHVKHGTQKGFDQLLHRGREVWSAAVRSMGSHSEGLDHLVSVLGLFGFATAYGMFMWITFVSSYVLSGALSPQQFGMVQSKIYKVYFTSGAYCVGMVLLGHLWSHRKKMFTGKIVDVLQIYNLMTALLAVLVNMIYLEPRSTKIMFERMKAEKEEGRGREHGAEQQPSTAEAEPSTTTSSQVPGRREHEAAMQSQVNGSLNKMREGLMKLNTYSSFLNMVSLMALSWHLVYLGQRLHNAC